MVWGCVCGWCERLVCVAVCVSGRGVYVCAGFRE